MREATDKADAMKRLEGALGEYASYMVGLARELPVSAFTMGDAVENAVPSPAMKSSDGDTDDKDAVCKKCGAPKKMQAKKEDGTVEKADGKCPECGASCDANGKYVEKAEIMVPNKDLDKEALRQQLPDPPKTPEPPVPIDPPPNPDAAAQAAADAAAAQAAADAAAAATAAASSTEDINKTVNEAVAKALSGVTETIGKTVEKAVADLGAKIDTVAKDAAEAKEKATKAEVALGGKIVTDAREADPNASQVTRKAEGGLGIIDTAYTKGVRKSDSRYTDRAARAHRGL
jgi:hypothetical protein